MYSFCTIVTPDYIHYALALRKSLTNAHPDSRLYIFVSEDDPELKEKIESRYSDTYVLFCGDLCSLGVGRALYDKYHQTSMNAFRWSMKSVLLSYLIEEKKEGKIIYTDCDIQFYSSFAWLFDLLDQSNVLLTPHWRPSDPMTGEMQFIYLYTQGIYNAGFIGVNARALDALAWWANANLFICEIDGCRGQYVDQAHLNLMPVYFDDVLVLKHRGCNVAGWNLEECRRTERDGEVLINGKWPIVFIHFSRHTEMFIEDGRDPLLAPHLSSYRKSVDAFRGEIPSRFLVKQQPPRTTLFARIKNRFSGIRRRFGLAMI